MITKEEHMKRFVSEDEAYGPEYRGSEVGHGQHLDNVLAKLAHLDEEQERVAKAREQLRVEAEKLLEALHEQAGRYAKVASS